MAQYRAIIQGQRGQASRLGSKKSGLVAQVCGWNIGVTIEIKYNEQLKKDEIFIYKHGGSNNNGHSEIISRIIEA